jgi:O-antigen ligase
MELLLLLVVLSAIVWGAVFAQRASLWFAGAAFIAAGYVLGPPLFSVHAGPIPVTPDRILLVGLAAMFAWQWRQGRLQPGVMTGFDWLLIAALAYFTVRCALTAAPPEGEGSTVKPWWKLIAAFWVPAAIYFTARVAPRSQRSWRAAMAMLAALGLFLALTGFAEVFKQWWAVFPRYIANPELGTHFGRARGPALNSASLGVFLTICFWAAWVLVPNSRRVVQVALAGVLLAIAGGVFFTYTRSTWMGLAGGLAVIPILQMPRRWRLPAALGAAMCAAIGVAALGHSVTDLNRKDTDASAEHSVYQRASFVYVSMRMFRDAPIFGCGVGRFFDMKIPYLADRSQALELESLRLLDHHNTLLSVLTETGFVGFTLFVGLLAGWLRAAWNLSRDAERESWQRLQGFFALATVLTYLASALFHDLTLSPTEHWLLFYSAGVTVGLLAERQQAAAATAPEPSVSRLPQNSILGTTWQVQT